MRLRFQALAFLGSFLAFCLELAAAKLLLPRFGGSAYVWTGSMVFFQAILLAAYLYGRSIPSFPRFHLAALLLPFAFLPLTLPDSLPGANPYAHLFLSLLFSVGAPFFILSTTVVVAQSWLMRSTLPERKDGYWLYAASNAGAASGLLAYPLFIEPLLSLPAQGWLWRILYAAYAALCFSCADKGMKAEPLTGAGPSVRDRALWLLLSAAPCAALLAATNLLGMDFAAVPLLWIAPLAVYLLTFVLNFKRVPWYPDKLNNLLLPLFSACLIPLGLAFFLSQDSTPAQILARLLDLGKFGYVLFALFALSMIFHRSLAAGRPESERSMASYYSCIAAGGLLGSVLVGLLIPYLGRHIGATALDWAAVGAVAAAAIVLRDWDQLVKNKKPAFFLAALAVFAVIGVSMAGSRSGRIYSLRNFYGIYSIEDRGGVRWFFHGNTDHGMQFVAPERQQEPLAYYGYASPLGDAWATLGKKWTSVGVVGLGAGSIAAYGRPGMKMDFFELDPDVVSIARQLFSHLALSRASISVATGDARLSLAKSTASYDALVLDAFNSGSVPIHLLTTEAFAVYLQRLKPDGVILLHVSNRYLDLRPVLGAAARELGLSAAAKRQVLAGEVEDGRVASVWVAIGREAAMKVLIEKNDWRGLKASDASVWTDRHASLLPALAL